MYGCYFLNFDYTKWFDTLDDALEHGKSTSFQFKIIEENV